MWLGKFTRVRAARKAQRSIENGLAWPWPVGVFDAARAEAAMDHRTNSRAGMGGTTEKICTHAWQKHTKHTGVGCFMSSDAAASVICIESSVKRRGHFASKNADIYNCVLRETHKLMRYNYCHRSNKL